MFTVKQTTVLTGLVILLLCFSGISAAASGPKATVEQLNAETAARTAADSVLQNNINNISLTPGPEGPPGNDGADGGDAEGPYVFMRPPEADDDINDPNAYSVGTLWVDTIGGAAYILIDNAPGSAVWKLVTYKYYAIGDTGPAGGIVFHVTDGGLHGLEAASMDPSRRPWGCFGTGDGSTMITGADGTLVGSGAQNTGDILTWCMEAGIAARIVDNFWLNGYNDWFLSF